MDVVVVAVVVVDVPNVEVVVDPALVAGTGDDVEADVLVASRRLPRRSTEATAMVVALEEVEVVVLATTASNRRTFGLGAQAQSQVSFVVVTVVVNVVACIAVPHMHDVVVIDVVVDVSVVCVELKAVVVAFMAVFMAVSLVVVVVILVMPVAFVVVVGAQ